MPYSQVLVCSSIPQTNVKSHAGVPSQEAACGPQFQEDGLAKTEKGLYTHSGSTQSWCVFNLS